MAPIFVFVLEFSELTECSDYTLTKVTRYSWLLHFLNDSTISYRLLLHV